MAYVKQFMTILVLMLYLSMYSSAVDIDTGILELSIIDDTTGS